MTAAELELEYILSHEVLWGSAVVKPTDIGVEIIADMPDSDAVVIKFE